MIETKNPEIMQITPCTHEVKKALKNFSFFGENDLPDAFNPSQNAIIRLQMP
jgi:hypothetical protein